MPQTNDDIFRRIADLYAREDGCRLLREAEEQAQEKILHATPRMDRTVRETVRLSRRKRFTGGAIGVLAAALLLLVLAPQLLRRDDSAGIAEPRAMQETWDDELAVEEYAAEEEYDDAMPEETLDLQADNGAVTGGMEIIPLSFALPENFAVAGVELDSGKSVYLLEDSLLDDVVMTLEYNAPTAGGGLTELELNGARVYARSTADYSLLAFIKDDISYVLTCRYDLNTLLILGRNIL